MVKEIEVVMFVLAILFLLGATFIDYSTELVRKLCIYVLGVASGGIFVGFYILTLLEGKALWLGQ